MHEFVARNGIISSGSIIGQTSFTASAGYVGRLYDTASYALKAAVADSISFIPASASYALTASVALNASTPTAVPSASWVSASAHILIADSASYFSGSIVSASYAVSASQAAMANVALTASYAGPYASKDQVFYFRSGSSDLSPFNPMTDPSNALGTSTVYTQSYSANTAYLSHSFLSPVLGVDTILQQDIGLYYDMYYSGGPALAMQASTELYITNSIGLTLIGTSAGFNVPRYLGGFADAAYQMSSDVVTLTSSLAIQASDRLLVKIPIVSQHSAQTVFFRVENVSVIGTSTGVAGIQNLFLINKGSLPYVLKIGDTMTGNLTAPAFVGHLTGTADTASFITASNVQGAVTTAVTAYFANTASFVTSSNIVGAIATAYVANTASYVTSSNVTGKVTSALNADTASIATSLSFIPTVAVSASWVSASAFITTAQTASFVTASNVIGAVTTAQTAYVANSINFIPQVAVSASWVSASVRITTADTASFVTASNVSGYVSNASHAIASDSATNATTASNAQVATNVLSLYTGSNATCYLPFFLQAGGVVPTNVTQPIYQNSNLQCNPSASSITVTSITASLLGTSSWASNFTLPSQIAVTGLTASSALLSPSYQFTQSYTNQHDLTNYTITNSDNGRMMIWTGSVTQTCNLATSSIDGGFSCMIFQSGSGKITVSAASGSTLRNRQSLFSTAGQYAVVTLVRVPSGDFVLGGDVAA